jgi:hypothetical protein
MYLDLKTDIIGLDVFGPFFRPFFQEKLLQNGKKLKETIVQSWNVVGQHWRGYGE